jgi:hypothetical protein
MNITDRLKTGEGHLRHNQKTRWKLELQEAMQIEEVSHEELQCICNRQDQMHGGSQMKRFHICESKLKIKPGWGSLRKEVPCRDSSPEPSPAITHANCSSTRYSS